jgi:hypothetical protein
VQNRAVEAIAAHFVKTKVPFVATGRRLLGICTDFTVNKQVDRDAGVVALSKHKRRVQTAAFWLRAGLRQRASLLYQPIQSDEDSHRARVRIELLRRLAKEALSNDKGSSFAHTAGVEQWCIDNPPTKRHTHEAQSQLLSLATSHADRKVNPWGRAADAIVRAMYPTASSLTYFFKNLVEETEYRLQKKREEVELKILTDAKALLVTTASLGSAVRDLQLRPLVQRIYAIVVDEAGTVMDRHLLPAVANCAKIDRVILVGDTRQLGVFSNVRTEKHAQGSTQSLMERLECNGMLPWMLTKQYRMPPSLGNLVSNLFYDGKLISETQADPIWPASVHFITVPKGKAERESDQSMSVRNQCEAVKAANAVNELIKTLMHQPDDAVCKSDVCRIAVLSTYAAQTRLLKTMLQAQENTGQVELLNVDAAQGREWDHVVLSTVSDCSKRVSFISNRRRLCVALSRAKKTFTLVANPVIMSCVPQLAALKTLAFAESYRPKKIVDVAALSKRTAALHVADA